METHNYKKQCFMACPEYKIKAGLCSCVIEENNNKSMKDHFVPRELSMRLKKLNFNEECLACHTDKYGLVIRINDWREKNQVMSNHICIKNENYNNTVCSAPTWMQAFEWIIQEYKISNYESIFKNLNSKEEYLTKLLNIIESNEHTTKL